MKLAHGLICLAVLIGTAPAHAQSAKLDVDARAVVQGNNDFAFDLYGRLGQEKGNLFFSPYSISTALGMTYGGARGETAQEMARTLHFTLDQARLHPAFGEIQAMLNSPKEKRGFKLGVANALWAQKNYGFLPDFLKLTQANYGAGLQELDFMGQTEKARQTINNWVEEKTQNKIKDLIPEGALASDTRLVLTNAIYFKAAWLEQFHADDTKKEDFHLTATTKKTVPMMHGQLPANYVETDDLQMVELPYQNHDLSMFVLVPKNGGLTDIEKSLSNGKFDQLLAKRKRHEVTVALPKFKMTAEFSLKKALTEMGMPLAFSKAADFSGMSSFEDLFIDAVLHKAFVDVNEEGTEAAAATAITIRPTSIQILPRATLRADRPFTFLIRENHTGSVLFMGRLSNPG